MGIRAFSQPHQNHVRSSLASFVVRDVEGFDREHASKTRYSP